MGAREGPGGPTQAGSQRGERRVTHRESAQERATRLHCVAHKVASRPRPGKICPACVAHIVPVRFRRGRDSAASVGAHWRPHRDLMGPPRKPRPSPPRQTRTRLRRRQRQVRRRRYHSPPGDLPPRVRLRHRRCSTRPAVLDRPGQYAQTRHQPRPKGEPSTVRLAAVR